MTDDIQYPVIVDFGDQGKESFLSKEELKQFFNIELDSWRWLQNIYVPTNVDKTFQGREPLNIFTQLNQWFELSNNIINDNFNNGYLNSVLSLYKDNIVFKSKSPKGLFINSLKQEGDLYYLYVAFGAFITFSKVRPNNDNIKLLHDKAMIEGSFLARNYPSKGKAADLTLVNRAYEEACEKTAASKIELSKFINEKEAS